jgi:RNA polymerase sigma-70 factor (ECF subfamily)
MTVESPEVRGGLEKLLRAARGRISRLARAFARSAEEAEDLEQEMSLAIVRDHKGYRGEGDARAWAGRVALNVCRMHARRRRLERSATEELRRQGLLLPQERPSNDAGEFARRLERALGEMDPGWAEALRMRSLAGLSYARIAEALGMTPGAVRVTVFRARRRLAELLGPYLEGRE